jgi:CheY-like chemotaxis protein
MKIKKKILIAEDELPLQKAISTKLKIEGFEVFVTGNGKECLDLAFDKKPDLILLDINMPEMDGITALKELKNNSKTRDIPVIMLTNYSESEKVSEVLSQGPCDYLIKSDWKLEDIVVKIKEKIN